jgi:hypothetical protein
MKVKIGPYKNWFGPYQLAEKLMFWVPEEKDEYGFFHTAKKVHNFGEWLAHGSVWPEPEVGDIHKWRDRPHTWLYKFLSWVHSKQEQTIKVHIDRWDTWSMDHTLGHIILPMLKQLKKTKHGAPFVQMKDRPPHLECYKEPEDYNTDKFHFEAWDWVLDEMIFAFECKSGSLQDWENQFYTGDTDTHWIKQEDGNYLLVKGENDTSAYDADGHKKFYKRITNGFRLFGKYYDNLWD